MSTPDLVSLAAKIATEAHRGQFRRDGVTPYIGHPAAVAARVTGDPSAEAVAWLHDVLEDTATTPEDLLAAGIPGEVVQGVVALTKVGDRDYEEYLRLIKQNPVAKRVKIADMLANLSDTPSERQMVKYARGLLA